jgi:hypothetical protein
MWKPGDRAKLLFCVTAALLGLAALAIAQSRDRGARLWDDVATHRRPPEDAEFVFARIRYNSAYGGFGFFRGNAGWAHDYPDAEEHILQVSNEATRINLHKMSYVIVDLDSEEIFRYPFIYFSEVGEMGLTDKETVNFREYLDRGGFAMIDDFDSQVSLDHFLSQMKRVFPEREFVRMTIDHPLFHTFYEIPTLDIDPPYGARDGGPPTFYGYFDDRGRLTMIICHNNDVGDFWEWIDQPRYPLQPSTEALRFGVNFFIYSLTH